MPAQATPQRNASLPHLGRAFTDIQEKKQVARLKKVITNFWRCRSYSYVLTVHLENKTWKPSWSTCTQVAGGTDFILKNLAAFNVPTMKSTIMMDMVGYDGFPALSCVEDCTCSASSSKKKHRFRFWFVHQANLFSIGSVSLYCILWSLVDLACWS